MQKLKRNDAPQRRGLDDLFAFAKKAKAFAKRLSSNTRTVTISAIEVYDD